jgi:hypothetical protein
VMIGIWFLRKRAGINAGIFIGEISWSRGKEIERIEEILPDWIWFERTSCSCKTPGKRNKMVGGVHHPREKKENWRERSGRWSTFVHALHVYVAACVQVCAHLSFLFLF